MDKTKKLVSTIRKAHKKIGNSYFLTSMKPFVKLLEIFAEFILVGEDIVILEIGVNRGTSTKAFLRGIDRRHKCSGKLYSIDIGKFRVQGPDKDKGLMHKYWEPIMGDSRKVDWNLPIDILLLDGDHSYEGTKADYEKYEPFVKFGGAIFLHDTTMLRYGVKDYWKEIKYPKIPIPFNQTGLGAVVKI